MSVGVLRSLPLPGHAQRAVGGGALGIDMNKFLGCPSSLGFEKNTQPLPAGRYWIDIIGEEKVKTFLNGLNIAQDNGVVVVENVVLDPSPDDSVWTILQRKWNGDSLEQQAWVLFRVTGVGSIGIDATMYGFPTKAPSCVKDKDQTLQAPEVKEGVDAVPWWVWAVGGTVVLLVVANSVGQVATAVTAVKSASK